jgi:peptide/nickel transport system permease protein
MAGYLVRRVLWAAVLLLVLTAVAYILFFVIAGGGEPTGTRRTAGPNADVSGQLQLSGPVPQQYLHLVKLVVTHGSLGRSLFNRREVNALVTDAAPVTASIVVGGIVLTLLIALTLGIASALRPRSLLDRGATTFTLVGMSLHPAALGLGLGFLVGFKLGWLPLGGYCDLRPASDRCSGPIPWASHLVLPWLTFALPFAAIYTRMVRALVLEALQADHVRFARAKGAPESQVLRSHVLRPALLPLVAMVAADLGTAFVGSAFAGTIFVERVFGLPGIGALLLRATARGDLPVIVGVTLFVLVLVIALSLVADLIYPLLDPRVRLHTGFRLPTLRRAPQPASASQPAQTLS